MPNVYQTGSNSDSGFSFDPFGFINGLFTGAADVNSATGSFYNFQQDQALLDYQKKLQDKIFERDDTAVARRMADLRKAGLNPVLAAGQAAQSGSVVSTKAPHYESPNLASPVQAYLDIVQQKKNIAMSDVQIALNREKVREAAAVADTAERDNAFLEANNMLSTGSTDNSTQQLIHNAFPKITPQGSAILSLITKVLEGGGGTAARFVKPKVIYKK